MLIANINNKSDLNQWKGETVKKQAERTIKNQQKETDRAEEQRERELESREKERKRDRQS